MTEDQSTFIYEGPGSERLDKFLVAQLPEFSRSRLQGLIRAGWVYIDEQPAQKTGQALESGMVVRVEFPPPEPTELIPEAIELDILYEDDNVLVVNKPAGMVVHPAAGHYSGTLVHAALAHAPEMEGLAGEKRPGVVHRLDKDTSGIILLAKNDRSHRWLQEQFRRREVDKVYLALVDGHPPTPSGRIEAAVGRDPRQRKQMAVLPAGQGRAAVSEYFTRRQFKLHTLLEVHPITGRTHQIRVHLAFVGCPVTGDTRYGRSRPTLPLARQFLHAHRLKIRLPGEKSPRLFEAPLPAELAALLDELPPQ